MRQATLTTQPDQGNTAGSQSAASPCQLVALPIELLDSILLYLSPVDLKAVSATCTHLYKHATANVVWRHHVQENVPGARLSSPHPFPSYRRLYAVHEGKWFLPKYKIWFSDQDLTGKLLIARYDQRHGCIEGYQLVAVSSNANIQHHWFGNVPVSVHAFEPRVSLHLDKPILKFSAEPVQEYRGASDLSLALTGRFTPEVPLVVNENSDGLFYNFLLASPMHSDDILPKASQPFPYGYLWPPPTIPAPHRVVGAPSFRVGPSHEQPHVAASELPGGRSEASDRIFRIRQWIEMPGSPPPGLMLGEGVTRIAQALTGQNTPPANIPWGPFVSLPSLTGIRLDERIITYSTLDPALYTPTPLKPWRGIWVGDYSAHGCEFLLVHQPDGPPVSDEELGLSRGEGEAEEDWELRQYNKRVYRGQIEAIKLTGDPNIPRGEVTFSTEDLENGEYVGETEDGQFQGAWAVRSRGHVAGAGFIRDEFVESKLFLLSHDRLAQRWFGFNHVSFFERVDIDRFLDPEDPRNN
ncbi:uncharacterized protein DNG_04737 [Cephalotrichum gorgonifer]|uniref:F-box domain-containing protein n=1 Tax=Cephalotrichum gorgonifer TaxID=2041049 RepID=A0AAE8MYP5_9PEZI|nr:uncharacterized protein DNG_04737 [Cephalotrichum gorgonifer]